MSIAISVFLILHGLVHLLYLGQSLKRFELQPGMTWPQGSWAFSGLLGDDATRALAGLACILAAVGFAAGGAGILLEGAWWRPLVVGAAILSTAAYALFWNGKMQGLDDQGGIGILINVVILAAVLVFRWPAFGF